MRRDRFREAATRKPPGASRSPAPPSPSASVCASPLPMDLGDLLRLWIAKGDPGEPLDNSSLPSDPLESFLLRASAHNLPAPSSHPEPDFASLWLKMPAAQLARPFRSGPTMAT